MLHRPSRWTPSAGELQAIALLPAVGGRQASPHSRSRSGRPSSGRKNLTDATREALTLLRDPANLKWYVVTFLGIVLYVYANEVERKRWDIVAAGLAFFLMDVFNELVNSAWLHVSGRSALWTVTGDTAYLILIGWTAEIVFLFAISGVEFVKYLLSDEVQTGFAELDMGLPTNPAAGGSVSDPALAGLLEVRDAAPYVQLYFDTAFGASVGGAMNDAIALMFAGQATPQDIVDATQAAADAEK